MDLIIPFQGKDETPLYEQIYRYIKSEIKNGNMKAGLRLPSTRRLAENLKVSRSTTQLSYDQLVSEGYIEAVPCKGYFVAEIDQLIEIGGKTFSLEAIKQETDVREKPSWKVDFSPRGVDLSSFPFQVWRKLSRNVLGEGNKEIFAAGDAQGEGDLRRAIKDYLHSARGVVCTSEQIIVGAGSEYLLMLLCQVLNRGLKIAMENPTYKQAYRVLESLGMEMEPVEMDAFGMEPLALENSGAQIAYIMPSHQYPTGIVMPVKRRQELLQWAGRKAERYLIEDDYDSEFRYKGKPVPALQGMDAEEKVIYLGTFSKSIAPAIRVSYMVLPPALLKKYREKAGFYACTVPRTDQNILYYFLEEGHYERHLNRMRAIYRTKHDLLLGELKKLEKNFHVRGENAGLHILLTSKNQAEEKLYIKRAEEKGVRVYGMSSYLIEGKTSGEEYSNTVILGYANLTEDQIKTGVRLLEEAWQDM